jgi:hypothetical protein
MSAAATTTSICHTFAAAATTGIQCQFGKYCKFLHILPIVAPVPADFDFEEGEGGPIEELGLIKTRLPKILSSKLTATELLELGDIYATVYYYLSSEEEVAELAHDIYTTFKMDTWTEVNEFPVSEPAFKMETRTEVNELPPPKPTFIMEDWAAAADEADAEKAAAAAAATAAMPFVIKITVHDASEFGF